MPRPKSVVLRISPRPVLLVYAAHGQGGEELDSDYFAAAIQPKQLWEITDGGHTGGIVARPRGYERCVIAFFRRRAARRELRGPLMVL